ncbi:MAG: flagellar biosynthesis protein FlhB [Phycisphaerales bacterium]
MAEDLGDRTEKPTSRKLEEARSRGQIAKSQDLSSALDLTAALILLSTLGGGVVRAFGNVLTKSLEGGRESIEVSTVGPLLRGIAIETVGAAAPVLGGMVVAGVLAQMLQTGGNWSTHALTPRLDRLNPLAGLKRLVGVRGGAKSGVNFLKLAAVLYTAWSYINSTSPRVVQLPMVPATQSIGEIMAMLGELAARLLVLLITIGLIDYIYQRWQHTRDLKMTKEEVKDERRSMDGDPQVRARRMRMMRDLAVQRINSAVPRSKVVLTNPTHYSVAVEYDPETMHAPRVSAKGADHMAMRIRQVAISHGVPIVERPPLARALYANVEVGQEISPEFYEAVAEVLAYVYRLEAQAA